jgi:dCTP deaminase
LSSRNARVIDKLHDNHLYKIDLTRPAVLERGCAYMAPLIEELNLPADISGKANPKSTTGRLDVFTRLITDYGSEFERVPAGYKGKLYTEIVPRTFSIVVEQGVRLNQLRLRRGNPPPSDTELARLHEQETLVYNENESPADALIANKSLWLSVDLSGDESSPVIGYKARHNTGLIDLGKINHYDPLDYWEPIHRTRSRTLVLDPNDFYILASKERVRIPQTFAAEMVPYDPSVGEFRIHYAGFFDPGFGYGADDIKGTHAVLEVRSHEVPFLLEDGQVVGRLVFERLLSAPTKVYGQGIGSSYQHQRLALSKQFKRG